MPKNASNLEEKLRQMQSYKLKYHKNSILLRSMVAFPVCGAIIMYALLSSLPQSLSEWKMLLIVGITLSLMIVFCIWMINTQLIVKSYVKLNDTGINIKINKPTLFYTQKNFTASWNDVSFICEKYDARTGSYYYQIEFKNASFKANFNPLTGSEDEAEHFYSALRSYQLKFGIVEEGDLLTTPFGQTDLINV